MDFPNPRDDPVTRMTLASSATILRDDVDLGVNAKGVAGANADDAAAERRTRVADRSFMVTVLVREYERQCNCVLAGCLIGDASGKRRRGSRIQLLHDWISDVTDVL